jgi:hypothetical protein
VTFKDWGQTGCLKCSIGIVPYVLSIQDVEVSKLICGTLLAKTTRKKDPANTEGCQERYNGGKMACGVRRSDPIAAMPAATYMSVRKSLFYTRYAKVWVDRIRTHVYQEPGSYYRLGHPLRTVMFFLTHLFFGITKP